MSMKKIITYAVVIATVAAIAVPALAENGGTTTTNHIIGTRPPAPSISPRFPIASNTASRSQEIKQRLTDAKKKLLTRWWTEVSKRLGNLMSRQGKLADRIQERITKLSGQGINTATAAADLALARTAITAAGTALTTAGGQVTDIIANNTPADAFKKLHDLQKTVLSAIRTAEQALIKAALDTRGTHPSTSPSVSPSPTASPSVTPTPSV